MKEVESTIFYRIKDEIIFCLITKKIGIEEELQLTKLIAEAPEEETKKILLKINLNDSFESNFKKVQAFSMNDLKNVLVYLWAADPQQKLTSDITRLKSDGLALEIIKTVYNLLDHTCTTC